ncbi:hypothetical protein DH2020_000560 [Rehmannia glutinosa]|uniref:UBA domain-containing protein n=1 Tax=Rehmannia glutinosa TaxID=99300 RepID=A0ABR0XXA2_REHGL
MEVDKRLLGELEAMGFSEALATKALCSSGNSSIEDAVNWLVDHENDTAASETPMQPQILVNISIEASNPFRISEQVKLRAQALRKGFDQVSGPKESRERGREKSTDKIRQKLQQDKDMYLPTYLSYNANLQPVDPAFLPVKRAAVSEQMRECLRSLKRQNKVADVDLLLNVLVLKFKMNFSPTILSHGLLEESTETMMAFRTLLIYVKNIINNPDEEKFRKIRISNPVFQDRVGKFEDGIKFLELCGFERVEEISPTKPSNKATSLVSDTFEQ